MRLLIYSKFNWLNSFIDSSWNKRNDESFACGYSALDIFNNIPTIFDAIKSTKYRILFILMFCFSIHFISCSQSESKWEYYLLSIHQNQLIRPSLVRLKMKDEKQASNLRQSRLPSPLLWAQTRHYCSKFIIETSLVVNQFSLTLRWSISSNRILNMNSTA